MKEHVSITGDELAAVVRFARRREWFARTRTHGAGLVIINVALGLALRSWANWLLAAGFAAGAVHAHVNMRRALKASQTILAVVEARFHEH